MINFSIKDAVIRRSMGKLAQEFPKEFRRGMYSVGRHYRKELKTSLQKGRTPEGNVDPLDPLTLQMRKAKGIKGRGHGGQLKNAIRFKVDKFGGNVSVTIGFTASDQAAKAAVRFQHIKGRILTGKERRYWIMQMRAASKSGNRRLAKQIRKYLDGGLKTGVRRDFVNAQKKTMPREVPRIIKKCVDEMIRKSNLKKG